LNHPDEAFGPLKLDIPLTGAFLISPWVNFVTDAPSWTENADKDIFSENQALAWAYQFADQSSKNNYVQASLAEESWWSGVPVKQILILATQNK